MNKRVLFAGFGGQGILFSGRVLANAGLVAEYEVSWVPSYGPETRGGTSNCAVVISDRAIGSPLVTTMDVLVAMNAPSYDRFIDSVVENGLAIIDSSLIDREPVRKDIRIAKIAATTLAEVKGFRGLANMILLGRLLSEIELFSEKQIEEAVTLSVTAARENLIKNNLMAIRLGMTL